MKCPWYLSAAAVKAYMRLERMDVDSEGDFNRAEGELMAIAIDLVARKEPTRQRNGLLR